MKRKEIHDNGGREKKRKETQRKATQRNEMTFMKRQDKKRKETN
jgi:hypothetical protein